MTTLSSYPAQESRRLSRSPIHLTRFVGRRAELAALSAVLGEHRLVTVTGAGGCGKSRLTVELVRGLDPDARWVDLASIGDADLVAVTVAEALGVPVAATADPTTATVAWLDQARTLIVVDNCEHVLDAAASFVHGLLAGCRNAIVVATSREPLGIPGEVVWRVPPMADAEIVELFDDRARAAFSSFAPDDDDRRHIATICRRLDGIPLAVELAAAWARTLTPAQIAAGLDDRFRLLVGGSSRALPRHQTLHESVAWSYQLLDDDARRLLARSSVFVDSFDLGAAEAVCADEDLPETSILTILRRLVDASIVSVDRHGPYARYRLPETIREFARARLGEAGETAGMRDRHLRHFLHVAQQAADDLDGGDQDRILARLDAVERDLRAALDWAEQHQDQTHRRLLAAALARRWLLRGQAAEGLAAVRGAIAARPDDRSILQAELFAGSALLAMPAGRLDLNVADAARARELADEHDDDRTRALASVASAYAPFFTDYDLSQQHALEAQRFGRLAGMRFPVDFGLFLQACALGNQDRYELALPMADDVYASSRARHDRLCAALSRTLAMFGTLLTGDVSRSLELGALAIDLARPLQDYFVTGTVTSNAAWAQGVAGHVDDARRLLEPLVRAVRDAGPDVDVVDLRVTMGKLLLWSGDADQAVSWLTTATRLGDSNQDHWTAARALPALANALRHLGRAHQAAIAARHGADMSRRLGTPHLLAESLDELGHLSAAEDPDRAEDLYHEALTLRVERQLRTPIADSLDALAHLATASDDHLDALRWFAAADAARAATGYVRPPLDDGRYHESLQRLRTAVDQDAADTAHEAGSQLSLEEAIGHLTRGRGRRGRPSAGWASLTPAELAVARLVADGLTNPQIAERLFVSKATVKTHVAHIFTKLDIAARAELAAEVTRRSTAEPASALPGHR